MRCPSCDRPNAEGLAHCAHCSARLEHACPSCGAAAEATARFCSACGVRLFEAGAERRQLTVLFCDLVDSMELSARLDPEEWSGVLQRYQQAAGKLVTDLGGHVAQHLGDGLLAYFGWPEAHEDDAERAVRAGLALVERVPALEAGPVAGRLSVRVGIHTGPVVMDALGSGPSREQLALGEVPNIAARLKTAAEPDRVVMSGATLRLVRGIFVLEELGLQRLKGVPYPIPLYRVLETTGVRSRLDLAENRLTPFVGRHAELGALLEAWERALEGEARSLLVVGEAGVGKSRLIHQLRLRIGETLHTWLECRCSPYTQGTAFHPISELLTRGFAFRPGDSAADRIATIDSTLSLRGFDRDEAVPLVAELLGLRLASGVRPFTTSPELARRRTIELLVAWLLAIAEVQPIVLLLEDLHWIDPSSLEVLRRLLDAGPRARLLLLLTARPESRSLLPDSAQLVALPLGRLTRRQAREMVGALAPAGALPGHVVESILERADGIPLYVEELARSMLDVQPTAGDGPVPADLPIPATLQDSLMARLDRMGAAKEVAQRAAVCGREASFELLVAATGLPEETLRAGLERLVRAEILLVSGGSSAPTYAFKHALLQEAAYQSLLRSTRQELHERVARALVEHSPERAAPEPEVVARHFEAAGLVEPAVDHYERAVTSAQRRSAHGEAIAHLQRALELVDTGSADAALEERAGRLELALGASLIAVRGFAHPETEAAYERAQRRFEAAGDEPRLAAALTGLSVAAYTRGDLERSIALGEQVLAIGERRGERALRLLGHAALSSPQHFQARFAESLAHCEEVIRLYEPAQDHLLSFLLGGDVAGAARSFAAWNLWIRGEPDRARQRASEAVERARALSHPFSLAASLFSQGMVDWLCGDAELQRRAADEVMALCEAHGFPLWLGVGRVLHAAARLGAAEEREQALADASRGISDAAGTGNQSGAPVLLALLAEVQSAAGRSAEALATLEGALALSEKTGQPHFDAELLRMKGELLRGLGAEVDAEALFVRALELAREQDALGFELRAATSLARLRRDQGSARAGRELLAPIQSRFDESLETRDLAQARRLLEELGARSA